MARLPDDLFEELHRELSSLMMQSHADEYYVWYVCAFCQMDIDGNGNGHAETCLGMRLMRSMDAVHRCVKCREYIEGTMYGAGDGTGQRFQCENCYRQDTRDFIKEE